MASFFGQWEEWSGQGSAPFRRGRFPLMRLVRFSTSAPLHERADETSPTSDEQEGLSLNLSDGGLCMLTGLAPQIGDVLRIRVPTPLPSTGTPTLAEVRWVRPLPAVVRGSFVVGIRFLL